jgi:hypothetical protein
MKYKILSIAFISAIAASAFADEQCVTNFTSSGSFFKGKTFKTWADIDGVDSAEAYKKIYAHVVKDGWKINSSDKEMGVISAGTEVSYGNGKSAPFSIAVEKAGELKTKVSLAFSTSGGVSAAEKDIIKSFCGTIESAK